MSWQRRARAGLAVLGLAAAVAVFVLARDRVEPPPVSLEPTDAEVELEGGSGTELRLSGPFENVRFSFSAWKQFKDGRFWYQDLAAVFQDDGVEVRAGEALQSGGGAAGEDPAELELSGDVTVLTTDGLELRTPRATYTSTAGVVTMPEAVEIRKGRLTATGVGGFYDRPQELFRILDQARLTVAPMAEDADADSDAGETINASATTMTMARREHLVRLEGQARIERPTETLTSDVATIYFHEDTEQVRLLDMHGAARVEPAPDVADAPPEMRGDTISMTFRPEVRTLQQATLAGNASLALIDAGARRTVDAAWIDLQTGPDGRTLTRLDGKQDVVVTLPAADGAPARTIRAPLLSATGADGAGLERARFDGGVEFVERGTDGGERTGRSEALTLALDGGFDAVDEAEFERTVRFEGNDVSAAADRAVYRQRRDELDLFGADGAARPHAESGRLSVDAVRITLGLAGDRVRATGNVQTVTNPDPESADRPTALFAADQPVVGAAETFEYAGEGGQALYRGTADAPARLLQDGNEVSGLVITVDEDSGNLTADGTVVSRFVLDGEDDQGQTRPTTYTIRGDRLDYVEETRAATYTGAPVFLESGEARSEAESIVLTVAAESREVEAVFWRGRVYALLEDRYEAKGSTLHHDVASGDYRLEGAPAVTKLPAEGRTDCARSSGLVTIFNRRTGKASWPQALNARARQTTEQIPCGASIR